MKGGCPACGRRGGVSEIQPKAGTNLIDTVIESTSLSALLFAPDAVQFCRRGKNNQNSIRHLLLTNEHFNFLRNITQDEEVLKSFIRGMSTTNLSQLCDHIQGMTTDLANVFKMGLRIKNIFDSTPAITGSLTISEAMNCIVQHICECLECDRATIFKLDIVRGELWSQIAKRNNLIIRIPMDQGIAGYVATEKRDLNIRDAYQDDRFNSGNDVKTGYRTKTILAMPIVNEMGEVEGVIQAINKLPSENNMARYFTKDDEGLLKMLCNIAGVTLKNTQINTEQIQFHNNLRSVLTTGIALSR
jgi:hypothetical protein